MLTRHLTIDEVNSLTSENFIRIFGNVVDHSPSAAIGILKNRPFNSAKDISVAINNYLDALKENEKERILKIHPDVVARIINFASLILGSSFRIQDQRKLNDLNRQYKEKFGFPFIMSTMEKENDLSKIFDEMATDRKSVV